MNAHDYHAVTIGSDVYCIECIPDNLDIEDADPIYASYEYEADDLPECVICGEVHDYVTVFDPEEAVDDDDDDDDDE